MENYADVLLSSLSEKNKFLAISTRQPHCWQ